MVYRADRNLQAARHLGACNVARDHGRVRAHRATLGEIPPPCLPAMYVCCRRLFVFVCVMSAATKHGVCWVVQQGGGREGEGGEEDIHFSEQRVHHHLHHLLLLHGVRVFVPFRAALP